MRRGKRGPSRAHWTAGPGAVWGPCHQHPNLTPVGTPVPRSPLPRPRSLRRNVKEQTKKTWYPMPAAESRAPEAFIENTARKTRHLWPGVTVTAKRESPASPPQVHYTTREDETRGNSRGQRDTGSSPGGCVEAVAQPVGGDPRLGERRQPHGPPSRLGDGHPDPRWSDSRPQWRGQRSRVGKHISS